MTDEKKTIEVDFVIGDEAFVKAIDEVGHVSAIRVGSSGTMYLVIWWTNADRKEEWLNRWELAP